MAYKYSVGKRDFGDIEYEDDVDTQIDFESDFIALTTAGTQVLVVSGSTVGIGTSTPEAYLDIKNTVDDGATNRTMIQMYNYRADDADENDWAPTSIDFKIENVAGGVKGATARIATVIAPVGTAHNSTEGEKSSALIFSTMDDTTLAEAVRINNVGNVGIGTTSPDTLVHLKGSSPAVTLQRNNNSTDTSTINFEGSAGVVACQVGQVAGTDNELAFSVHDGSNLLERMRIAENGNIGIGTTDPGELLTLNATEPTIQFQESGTARGEIGINDSDNIVIENKTQNKHIVFKVNDAGTTREGIRVNGAVPEVVVNEGSESLVDFRVESDSDTHMLFVDGGNNTVGVATSAPTSGLHVDSSCGYAITGAKSSDYTATASDHTILVNATNASVTITLPTAVGIPGRLYIIKRLDATNLTNVAIAANGSEEIEASTDDVILGSMGSLVLQSDNSGWWIVGQYSL